MFKTRYRQITILSVVAMGATIFASPAAATLMVNLGGTISGGVVVGGTTYVDNEAGVDSNPAIGVLDLGAYLDSVAVSFVVNGFSASSGSPVASLALTANANLQPRAVLPLTVSVIITDTDFTSPETPLRLAQTINLLSSVGGITAVATGVGYYGDSNTPFDVDGPSTADATSAVSGGVGINVPGVSGTISGPAVYSLTSAIEIEIVSRGLDPIQNLQLNGNLSAAGQVIPEPTTAMFLGSGLLALTAGFVRKSFSL